MSNTLSDSKIRKRVFNGEFSVFNILNSELLFDNTSEHVWQGRKDRKEREDGKESLYSIIFFVILSWLSILIFHYLPEKMSRKVLSLDIQKGIHQYIDLVVILPLSETAVVRHRNTEDTLDDMSLSRGDIDIFEVPTIHISRFHRFENLDLAHPSIFSRRSAKGKRRKRHINLVRPLYVPYGSLDIRLMRKIPNEKRYSDLFVRSLSRSLMIRRQTKQIKKFLRKNQRGFV